MALILLVPQKGPSVGLYSRSLQRVLTAGPYRGSLLDLTAGPYSGSLQWDLTSAPYGTLQRDLILGSFSVTLRVLTVGPYSGSLQWDLTAPPPPHVTRVCT